MMMTRGKRRRRKTRERSDVWSKLHKQGPCITALTCMRQDLHSPLPLALVTSLERGSIIECSSLRCSREFLSGHLQGQAAVNRWSGRMCVMGCSIHQPILDISEPPSHVTWVFQETMDTIRSRQETSLDSPTIAVLGLMQPSLQVAL
jgi:hypothetical protein